MWLDSSYTKLQEETRLTPHTSYVPPPTHSLAQEECLGRVSVLFRN